MIKDPSAWVASSDKHDLIKHWEERQTKGFSEYDWWNFSDYLAWINIQGLEKFKTGHGHPADLNSLAEWHDELDIMIEGFKAHITLESLDYNYKSNEAHQALLDTHQRGMLLYAKRFRSLWD